MKVARNGSFHKTLGRCVAFISNLAVCLDKPEFSFTSILPFREVMQVAEIPSADFADIIVYGAQMSSCLLCSSVQGSQLSFTPKIKERLNIYPRQGHLSPRRLTPYHFSTCYILFSPSIYLTLTPAASTQFLFSFFSTSPYNAYL